MASSSTRYTITNGSDGKIKLASAVNTAHSATIREGFQRARAIIDGSDKALRRGRVIRTNILEDETEVLRGCGRPADLHLGTEHLLDPGTYFFMGQRLSPVELVQAFLHLLAKPSVMVERNAPPTAGRIPLRRGCSLQRRG